MNVGKIIKIAFYLSIGLLVFKGIRVAYNKYHPNALEVYTPPESSKFKLEFKEINVPKIDPNDDKANPLAYDFKQMLDLIEACEKVKYLEYLRFSRPKEAVKINPETLQDLIKSVRSEKHKLRKHITELKACSRDSIPSKRIKALKYYLRVLELNLQELKSISTGKIDD